MAIEVATRAAQVETRELVLGLKADGATGEVRQEPCGCTTYRGEAVKIGHVCRHYEPCGCQPLNGEDTAKICPFHGQFLIDKILAVGLA